MREIISRQLDKVRSWFEEKEKPTRIGLVLGSGAALGVAHVGVLSVIHEMGIPVSFLSGCSAGSIVGALYASGIEGKELEDFGRKYSWRDTGKLNYLPKMGLARNDRVVEYLKDRIGDPRFEDLRFPFFVASVHMASGKLRVFNSGPVIPAVQASCAIPGIFSPVKIDGELYCDGGILSKNPCRILKAAGADRVICSVLDNTESRRAPSNIFEVIRRSIDISMQEQVEAELKTADLIIRPDLHDLKDFDFDKNPLLIERGREAARKALEVWMENGAVPRTELSLEKPAETNPETLPKNLA